MAKRAQYVVIQVAQSTREGSSVQLYAVTDSIDNAKARIRKASVSTTTKYAILQFRELVEATPRVSVNKLEEKFLSKDSS